MNSTTNGSYYKVLGTTAKISQQRIKEKYIEAVRQHPPETDPDQFEKVRKAYEVLKDPVKRKEYDLMRKYGGKIERMLEKASEYVANDEISKARDIYEDVLTLNSTILSAKIGLMFCYVIEDELDKAYKVFHELKEKEEELAEEGSDLDFVYSVFAKMLIQKDHIEEAFEVLEEGLQKFSVDNALITEPLTAVCIMLEKYDRAIEVAEMAIPTVEEETVEDVPSYIIWIHTISQIEKWSMLSKIQSRFRKLLKGIDDEEDKVDVFYALIDEYEEAYDHQKYRLAEIFLDFAKLVQGNQFDIKEEIKEVKKLVRLEKDFHRLFHDDKIFPLVLRNAVHWYFGDEFHPIVQQLESQFTPAVIADLEEEEEYYAASILYIQKKYPALYNYYKEDWDDLFQDLTKDFNREMKRGLKKFF
ncbi:DnaJ domain-containing protein [Evansella sp. AB-P1]|uniref:J domain-containing protein n=1 Tax=Evansella sp. AB-P1 TaxID=3037653 RepID=UPI00241ED744|nr:DnaJ domain-containing protein [Evansella sp. AB-P1]MDG5789392.1 DnaJ domain-containing protein [Evansella sp. AB-P1]